MDSKDSAGDNTSPSMQAAVMSRAKRSSQALTGVVLVVLGLIFLVDRMGWQWGWHVSFGRLWPLLLIVSGIGTMLTDRDADVPVSHDAAGQPPTVVPKSRRRYGDGLPLVLVGVLMLLHVNHYLYLSQTWPLFIVAAGLSILFGRGRRGARRWRGEGR